MGYCAGVGEDAVIARGRDAEILDLGGGRVLRRFSGPRPLAVEALVMRLVREAGYPVPEVFEVRRDGMVLERVDGPTMLDDLATHPWRVRRHARMLAALHRELHQIRASEGLPARFGEPGPDDVVIHGDLHPGNVMLSRAGPVVIDWTSGGRGPAGADVADAWLILASAQPAGGLLMRALAGALRGRFLDSFLREAGRSEATSYLELALEERAADPNLTPAEKAAMRKVAAAHGILPGAR
jgi:aminoglycoside phosphotransferase (APT) family kinase protein